MLARRWNDGDDDVGLTTTTARPSSLSPGNQTNPNKPAALLDAPARSSSADSGKQGDDDGGTTTQQQQQLQKQQQQALPMTTGGRGAVHICEVVACKLPPEKWWLGEGKKGRGGGGSAATSARAGRAGSAPPQLKGG